MARGKRTGAAETPSSYKPVVLSILTFCLITQHPDLYAGETFSFFDFIVSLLSVYEDFSLLTVLLLPGLFLFYRYVSGRVAPGALLRPSVWIPALLFGIAMPLGYAFQEVSDLSPLFSAGIVPFLQTLGMAAGWFLLADHCIALLWHMLEKASGPAPAENVSFSGLMGRYRRALSRRPFLTVFLTMSVLYIPHAVLSFPGIFMGDTWQQVVQAYSELGLTGSPYLAPENVMKAGVYINQNHPAVPTLMLHGLLVLGDAVTGNLNTGVALYCGLQAFCLIAAVSYTSSLLIRRGLFSLRFAWLIPLYGFIHPYIHTFLFLLTKDVFYAAFFLFLFTNLFRVMTGDRFPKVWTGIALSVLGIILFRNEGRYLMILSFLLAALICRENRKAFFIAFGGVILVSLLVFRLLFPLLGFTPGSAREPLSIPFQQTARFVRDYPDDVTEDEQEIIDRVIDYNGLADNYDPDISDPVKNTFRETASTADLMAYLKTWAAMGLRHPDACLQAFLNKNYQYFYPGKTRLYLYEYSWSSLNYAYTNQKIAPLNRSFSQPEGLDELRNRHDRFMVLSEELPLLNVLWTSALYAWVVILALCWALRRQNRNLIAWTIFPFILFFLNLFGPTNGYYGRYMFPVMLALPFFWSFLKGLSREKQQ